MNFKNITTFLITLLTLVFLASCGSENIDVTTIEEEITDPKVVTCDLTGTISEATTGSGILETTVDGGVRPYTYEWSTGETTMDIAVTEDGTYTVIITDSEGCTLEDQISVTLIDPCLDFVLILDESPEGTLSAIVAGGTPPYSYSWSTGGFESTTEVTESGTYSLTVVDAVGCTVFAEITTTFDSCNNFEVDINTLSNNILIAEVQGGIAPYSYAWSTGETTISIVAPESGTYSVTATDDIGCVDVAEIML